MIPTLKTLSPTKFSNAEVTHSFAAILRETHLLSLATTSGRNKPYINNAYFFADKSFRLGFISFPSTRHVRNIGKLRDAAVSIARSTQVCGKPIKGLQLFGRVREAVASERATFFSNYGSRFAASRDYCEELLHSPRANSARPLYFEIQRFKLIDERRFGEEVYVRGAILRRSGR